MGGREGYFYPSYYIRNPENSANISFEGDFVGGDKSGDRVGARERKQYVLPY
jgi:hypothetical protein